MLEASSLLLLLYIYLKTLVSSYFEDYMLHQSKVVSFINPVDLILKKLIPKVKKKLIIRSDNRLGKNCQIQFVALFLNY